MSLPKLLMFTAVGLSLLLGGMIWAKQSKKESQTVANSQFVVQTAMEPVEIELEAESRPTQKEIPKPIEVQPVREEPKPPVETPKPVLKEKASEAPEANRIDELFKKGDSKLKFIDTITYKSRVNWLKGRPAWLSDYASHYETSRHFIARSLNNKPDYFKQDIAEGDRFNVLKEGVDLKFHLVVDTSQCKMWLYAIDNTHKEKTLLKTYTVCLGRPDSSKASGLLTPLGTYSLGNRIAIYKPKVMGYHNAKKVEMVRIFGSRWIPFEKEIANTTLPAKGFGIHGVPWTDQGKDLVQDKSSLGKYESDGCIRLSTEDMEEIFAIIITKPATVEIVKNFNDTTLFK